MAPEQRKRRLLIVEDNPVIRDLFMLAVSRLREEQTSLAQIGGAVADGEFEVVEAEDGSSALDRILESEVDLVVTDLYLPVLSGIELIRRVRNTPSKANTRILAISASIQDARMQSLGAGADSFLPKPLRLIELLDAMRALLRLPTP